MESIAPARPAGSDRPTWSAYPGRIVADRIYQIRQPDDDVAIAVPDRLGARAAVADESLERRVARILDEIAAESDRPATPESDERFARTMRAMRLGISPNDERALIARLREGIDTRGARLRRAATLMRLRAIGIGAIGYATAGAGATGFLASVAHVMSAQRTWFAVVGIPAGGVVGVSGGVVGAYAHQLYGATRAFRDPIARTRRQSQIAAAYERTLARAEDPALTV